MDERFDQTIPESWQQPPPKVPKKRSVMLIILSVCAVVIGLPVLVLLAVVAFTLFARSKAGSSRSVEYTGKSMALRSFTLGTNENSEISDHVQLDLMRFQHSDGPSYKAAFNVRGPQPISVEEGNTVAIEVDGTMFFSTNELASDVQTNSFGKYWESLYLACSPEAIHALADGQSVVIHFDGRFRKLKVPLTAKNVEHLKKFAQPAKRYDANEYKSIHPRP
jgi:hypothetical protein